MSGFVSTYEITVVSDEEPDVEKTPTIETIVDEGDIINVTLLTINPIAEPNDFASVVSLMEPVGVDADGTLVMRRIGG